MSVLVLCTKTLLYYIYLCIFVGPVQIHPGEFKMELGQFQKFIFLLISNTEFVVNI